MLLHNLLVVLLIFSTEFVERRHKDVVVHGVGVSLLALDYTQFYTDPSNQDDLEDMTLLDMLGVTLESYEQNKICS